MDLLPPYNGINLHNLKQNLSVGYFHGCCWGDRSLLLILPLSCKFGQSYSIVMVRDFENKPWNIYIYFPVWNEWSVFLPKCEWDQSRNSLSLSQPVSTLVLGHPAKALTSESQFCSVLAPRQLTWDHSRLSLMMRNEACTLMPNLSIRDRVNHQLSLQADILQQGLLKRTTRAKCVGKASPFPVAPGSAGKTRLTSWRRPKPALPQPDYVTRSSPNVLGSRRRTGGDRDRGGRGGGGGGGGLKCTIVLILH